MRQWHASATARFGCIAATSARAYVSGLPPPPLDPVAAAVAKCYRTWHAAVASLPIAARPCRSRARAHASVRPTAGSARSLQHLLTQRGSGSQARHS
jgi:hypothetical protein